MGIVLCVIVFLYIHLFIFALMFHKSSIYMRSKPFNKLM
jgi:hypothetical protein